MPLDDEDVAVAGDGDIVRLIELPRAGRLVPLARFAFGSERQQDLALWIELHDDVRADVGGPDVSVRVDPHAVRPGEEAVTERSDERARRIELEERLLAAREDEHMPARVERDGGRGPHRHPLRQRHGRGHRDVIQFRSDLGNQQRGIGGTLGRERGAEQNERDDDGSSFHTCPAKNSALARSTSTPNTTHRGPEAPEITLGVPGASAYRDLDSTETARHLASGSGRSCIFTILPFVPFPPSMCQTKCVP